MGFGFSGNIDIPKVEVPKVTVPKVDIAGAVGGALDAAKGAVGGAIDAGKAMADGALGNIKDTLNSAVAGGAASLSAVAGAIADVAVSFKGGTVDFAMEAHLKLDANASYGDTEFKQGSILVRIDMNEAEAKDCQDSLHLFSRSRKYNESKKIGDSYTPSQAGSGASSTVDVEFTDAPMSDYFSLEIIPADGGKGYLCFCSVPYGSIGKKS